MVEFSFLNEQNCGRVGVYWQGVRSHFRALLSFSGGNTE